MFAGVTKDDEASLHFYRNLAHYGCDQIEEAAIEEMAELTKAIVKRHRAERAGDATAMKEANKGLCEELVDVIIMIAQLEQIWLTKGRFEPGDLLKTTREKLRRQAERLESEC